MSNSTQPYEPTALAQFDDLSKRFAQSALIPGNLRGKPGDVFLILLKGHEMGLSPLQSLATIHVIDGRPAPAATLKMALCLRSPMCEYIRCVETTDKLATYEAKRKGSEPVRLTWRIEQAQRAGLLGKTNWKNWPEAMLRARCESAICTAVFGDLVLGFGDEEEELSGFVDGIRQDPEAEIKTVSKSENLASELRAKDSAAPPRTLKKIVIQEAVAEDALFEPVKVSPSPAEQAKDQLERNLPLESPPTQVPVEKDLTPGERIAKLCIDSGLSMRKVLKDLGIEKKMSELTPDDVVRVRDHIDVPF